MTQTARNTLNMRIRPEDRALFDWAAEAQGKTRTDFILEAARKAAEEVLLDRTLVQVDPDTFQRFQALLDAPPDPGERLKRTMQTPAPWD